MIQLYDWLNNRAILEDGVPNDIKDCDLPKYSTWKALLYEAKRFYGDHPPLYSPLKTDVYEPEAEDSGHVKSPHVGIDQAKYINRVRLKVCDVFSSPPGNERSRLWKKIGKNLRPLGVPNEQIKKLQETHDVSGLLSFIQMREKNLKKNE